MRFQILIEGTVKPNPDTADKLDAVGQLAEMKQAVEDSFRPDEQWGVDMTSITVTLVHPEEGDSDS